MKKKTVKKVNKVPTQGKKTKLTRNFITAAKAVLNAGRNAFILTDEELIALINDRLVKEERISKRTFEDWKSGKTPKQAGDKAREFRGLLKRALIHQKIELFKKMEDDDKGWQRFAWMIERKFNDWNIRRKTDLTTDGEAIVGFNFIVPTEDKNKR